MPTTTRALLLDEFILPRATGDLGLESSEASFLAGGTVHSDTELPAFVIAFPSTAEGGESAAEGDEVMKPGILASGVLWPQHDEERPVRLTLSSANRVRIEALTGPAGSRCAAHSPWPYARSGVDKVEDLVRRFYRILIVTRSADDTGLIAQIEEPIFELEGAPDAITQLFLLADYLLATTASRSAVLHAEDTREVFDLVQETLAVIEAELPTNAKAVRQGVASYLEAAQSQGRTSLHKSASVLLALAPLLEPPAALTDALSTLVAEFADFEARLEHLTLRLLSQRPRR